MYNEYFGFKEGPFSIAPDPRYLYMTGQHREALAHLVFGLNSEGGCILLTGEVGTGKTTVCRCLLEQIPENSNIALVFNPKVTATELLETICDELKIDYPETGNTVKSYIDRINRFLIEANARNEKTVLIIDEAQNLDSTVLEQLRLLTNLETNQRKLLQIIILGQPELLEILSRREMRQLAQRITARFHLKGLSRDEIKAYISHRLAIAGQNAQLFPEITIKKLFRLSKGIPRLINVLCDRALLGAYVQNELLVTPQILVKASKEVFGELKAAPNKNLIYAWPQISLLAAVFATVAIFLYTQSGTHTPSTIKENQETISVATGIDPAIKTTTNNGSEVDTSDTRNIIAMNEPTDENILENFNISKIINDPTIENTIDPIENFIKTSTRNNIGAVYSALLKTWKHNFSGLNPSSACDYAQTKGLSCLRRMGNISGLSQLNRPAILKLYNENGDSSYMLLTYLNANEVTINTGKDEFKVSISTLDNHWLGEYTLLWQKPPYYDQALEQGSQGPIVQWLDQVLVRLYGQKDVPTVNDTYSDELVARVKKFQQSKGLIADGVAGPLTFIHLNNAIGAETPLLRANLKTSKS